MRIDRQAGQQHATRKSHVQDAVSSNCTRCGASYGVLPRTLRLHATIIPNQDPTCSSISEVFCDCISGMREAVSCNEDACTCVVCQQASMNDLHVRYDVSESMDDLPAHTYASSQMLMRCARAIKRRAPARRTDDKGVGL